MPVTREHMQKMNILQPIMDVITRFIDLIEGTGYIFDPNKIYDLPYRTRGLQTDGFTNVGHVNLSEYYTLDIRQTLSRLQFQIQLVQYNESDNDNDRDIDSPCGEVIYFYTNKNFDDVDYSEIVNLLSDLQN